jgi:hypothetical protein
VIDQKMIPPEVVEAYLKHLGDYTNTTYAAAIAAALAAWPGVYSTEPSGGEIPNATPFIILPLTEARDDR